MRRTLITALAAFALSTGTAVAADAPDSVLIGGKVEVKLGDNQGNVLAALSTVYKLEPYASETGTAFVVKTPEGKMVGTVAFDAKARVWWASNRLTDPRPALARVDGRECRVITWNAGTTVGVDCGRFRVGHDADGAFEEIIKQLKKLALESRTPGNVHHIVLTAPDINAGVNFDSVSVC